jgi:hypothetical protein
LVDAGETVVDVPATPLGADIDRLGVYCGHGTLVVHRKGGNTVTIPPLPYCPGAWSIVAPR